jgi:serine/threonine protein kinase/Tfp pilus assembly protein PilF
MHPEEPPKNAPVANDPELATTQSIDASDRPETVIGRYHLVRRIGEGGMGEVWLAEQKEPVRRRVALKLIKGGVYTREAIARFDSERQALALMDHPAIAKVFDAGSTSQGAPYFVMEYVAGVPITDYCDNHKLSIHERLELFRHVCEGVQHAHQKAIIHRDLKPSNILVIEVDGTPVPKIIDFGVAKALAQRLTADTMFTRAGALVGTPEYMSPEQAGSSGEDIDTRTDVYSLGIIFYELLAGAPPMELRKVALEEFLRRLREEEPPKPSTKIRTQDHAKSEEVARRRQTGPIALAKQMHGELDCIALKALEKDRARRYSSPSDLASDISRYLNNEAVRAVPPTLFYRVRKFSRRYRAVLVTACAFAIVLIAASVISIRQSLRANREAAVAQAVNSFLQNDLLAQASAATQSERTKLDPDLKVRTALDRAAVRITGKFDRQPEVEAAIRDTIGQTYVNLGLYPEAEKEFERALELRRRVLGTNDPETLKTLGQLGMAYFFQSNYAQAESLLSQTLEAARRALGPEHSETVRAMTNLGSVYRRQGKYPQAEALVSQALEIKRRTIGLEGPSTLTSMSVLAEIYDEEGKYAQAEALINQTLEIQRRVLGPEHPNNLNLMNNLANVYNAEGKYAQAEALHSQTLEIRRRVLGPEQPYTVSSMSNLADVYNAEGKYAEAESLGSQAIDIRRRILGAEHSYTLISMNNLAGVYMEEGKYAQAEALAKQTLEIRRRVQGGEHYETLNSMRTLADIYNAEHKYTEAEPLFRQTLEMQRRVLGAEHPDTIETLASIASLYQRQGKYDLAETYAAQALAGRRHTLGQEHQDTMRSATDLALAYQSQGKFIESEPLAREAMEINRKNWPDDWQGFRAESLLGASLAGEKKYAEAEPLLLAGYQGMVARASRIAAPDRYQLDNARAWISQAYQAWGKREKAAEWRKSLGPTKANPGK